MCLDGRRILSVPGFQRAPGFPYKPLELMGRTTKFICILIIDKKVVVLIAVLMMLVECIC